MSEEININNIEDDSSKTITGKTSGFPSPAGDYLAIGIDLNKELVKQPAATFFGKAKGNYTDNFGIYNNDILIIDKSLQPRNNDIVVCYIDGEFTLRKINFEKNKIFLSDNVNKKILLNDNIIIWGVVTYSIRELRTDN
ncbi:MAG: translesion error-prone DNA polymerase V autoproteolytic subunit [Bacteroidales bacterium]|jgi:DNA polymerase V|nr:translesion error-prone DNA polymerase V autoproteolytic subunit [Bacteroidales bacterium]